MRDSGWRVRVDGDAPLEIDIRFATEDYAVVSPGYTAHVAVNAVPAVCEAEPGIRTTADLPRIVPDFG